MQYKHPLNISK